MYFLLLAVCVGVVSCDRIRGSVEKANFEAYKVQYGKVYGSDESDVHSEVYEMNLNIINKHNLLFDQGKSSYYMGVNAFTDWTEEQRDARNGHKTPEGYTYTGEVRNGDPLTAPDAVDWREKGAVTGIKDQGQCGSCWAFGAVGSMEGAWAINKGSLPNASEQELVSCDVGLFCHGCQGGRSDAAMDWVHNHGENGLDTQDSYPYTAKDDACQDNIIGDGENVALTVGGKVHVAISEDALVEAVGNVGPVAVAIYANDAFQHYEGGVFEDLCLGLPNHAVLAVGYGNDGKDYWIVKNSWGTSWGEEGYIRMVRGVDICFIATQAYYATV